MKVKYDNSLWGKIAKLLRGTAEIEYFVFTNLEVAELKESHGIELETNSEGHGLWLPTDRWDQEGYVRVIIQDDDVDSRRRRRVHGYG